MGESVAEQISRKMLEARETARVLFGDQYGARVETWKFALRRLARDEGKSVLEAAIESLSFLRRTDPAVLTPGFLMMVMAALADIIDEDAEKAKT